MSCLAHINVVADVGFVQTLAPYGWIVGISYLVSVIATPLVRAVARRYRIVDKPDGLLKPHSHPIAYLGGVAVYLGWLAGMLTLLVTTDAPETRRWIIGLCLAGGLATLVGLLDDLFKLRPVVKLLGQALAGALLLVFGIGLQIIPNAMNVLDIPCPAALEMPLSALMTIFIVIAATNATNLLDGMDGLCSGVTGIISLMFLVLATYLAMYHYSPAHDPVRVVTALAMVGAVIGFLPYNYSPATIFLGDAGSILLGLFAAAMMLMFGERGIIRWLLGAVMIFGLPILDTSLALLRRLRLHRPIFAGDRSHLYDQLVDRGFTVKETVTICYVLSAFYGLMGLLIILLPEGYGRYSVLIYAGVAAATLYLCHRWGFLKPPIAKESEPRE
jgi:UDP-GlcNAc:undecaprenyl-phosphate/decaprenyl-phosphate GlcNAc-1-phosphate transferase